MKTLSVIILNWNGKKWTEDCIKSLNRQTLKNFEIIVVDNASSDGSVEYLKKKFPKIKIIKAKTNLGYAGGNNLGVKKTKKDFILILNNDTVLDKNFIKEMWNNKNKADILGSKNYYFDKKYLLWSVGSSVNQLTMKASLVGNKQIDKGQWDSFSPEQIVGSAMLINRKVIDKIGFLDEKYFCYYEETEWQTRAKKTGFKISWVPSAILWHKVGLSTGGGRTPTSAYYLTRNRAFYIKKWGKIKIVAYPHWFIESLARIFYGLIKRNFNYSKMTLNGMIAFFKGKIGKV
jgi:GT2 family glycosyltransferase